MCPVDWRVCFQVLVVYFAWCTNKFGYVPYTPESVWCFKLLLLTVKFSFSKNFISAAVCTLHFLLCMWTHARGMFHLEQQCLSTCVASCEEMCKLFMSVSVSWYYLFNIIIYKHVILHEFAFIIAKDDLWYHNVKKIPSSQNPLVHKML